MANSSRRKFIGSTIAIAAASVSNSEAFTMHEEKGLAHQVYFWLKNPESKSDLELLIKGIRTLTKISTVKKLMIGTVANTTRRDIIDSSWSVSELAIFDDVAGEAHYQTDPIHLEFVKNYSHLWSKVQIYDSSLV